MSTLRSATDELRAQDLRFLGNDELASDLDEIERAVRMLEAERSRRLAEFERRSAQADDEVAFAESPTALVYWAPIVDDLKALDEAIVRNSIRYRWHEVRRDLHKNLDAAAVMASAP